MTSTIDETTKLKDRSRLKFEIVWFDSMGAKSSSLFVETPDVSILIDPGASGMQPRFPMSRVKKAFYRLRALRKISGAARKAQVIVISHYHYDHYCRLDLRSLDSAGLYRGKRVFVKDPNQFVNFSQWGRAREFFAQLVRRFSKGSRIQEMIHNPSVTEFANPDDSMTTALGVDYADYQPRRDELMKRGRRWFKSLCRMWKSNKWIPEMNLGDTRFEFMDGQRIEFGSTAIRFTKPFFHGVEYDRLGWVCSTLVECNGVKLIHTSDVQGPVIEDVAEWIIKENPEFLFVDGPPTYLFGVIVNRTNFNRTIENACRIIRETEKMKLMVYDHHLMRDPLFRRRVAEVYRVAQSNGKRVISAAEYLGQEIVALRARGSTRDILDDHPQR